VGGGEEVLAGREGISGDVSEIQKFNGGRVEGLYSRSNGSWVSVAHFMVHSTLRVRIY